jgi:hypothetical protein
MNRLILQLSLLVGILIGCKPIQLDEAFPERTTFYIPDGVSLKSENRSCVIKYCSEELIKLYFQKKENLISNDLLFQAAEFFNKINPSINLKPTPYIFESNVYFSDGNASLANDPSGATYDSGVYPQGWNEIVFKGLSARSDFAFRAFTLKTFDNERRYQSYIFTLGRMLGLPENSNKQSWMYPYYEAGVKKEFSQEELSFLQNIASQCSTGDVVESTNAPNITAEGTVGFSVNFKFSKDFKLKKAGIIISENPDSLNVNHSNYYCEKVTSTTGTVILSTQNLNANTTYYYKGFLYGNNGVVMENQIKKLTIPNREHNKWTKTLFSGYIPENDKPVFAYNGYFYSDLHSTNKADEQYVLKISPQTGEIIEKVYLSVPQGNNTVYFLNNSIYILHFESNIQLRCYKFQLDTRVLSSILVPIPNFIQGALDYKSILFFNNPSGIFVIPYHSFTNGVAGTIFSNVYKLDFETLMFQDFGKAPIEQGNDDFTSPLTSPESANSSVVYNNYRGVVKVLNFNLLQKTTSVTVKPKLSYIQSIRITNTDVNSKIAINNSIYYTISDKSIYRFLSNTKNDLDYLIYDFDDDYYSYNDYFTSSTPIQSNLTDLNRGSIRNLFQVYDPVTESIKTLGVPFEAMFEGDIWKGSFRPRFIDGGDKIYFLATNYKNYSTLWVYHK